MTDAEDERLRKVYDLIDVSGSQELEYYEIVHVMSYIPEYSADKKVLNEMKISGEVLSYSEFREMLLKFTYSGRLPLSEDVIDQYRNTLCHLRISGHVYDVQTVEKVINRVQKRAIDIIELIESFEKIDDDSDGEINFNQLCRLVVNLGKPADVDYEIQKAFERAAGNNGTLKYHECLVLLKRLGVYVKENSEESYNDMFKLYDRDGLGRINFDEFKEIRVLLLRKDKSTYIYNNKRNVRKSWLLSQRVNSTCNFCALC